MRALGFILLVALVGGGYWFYQQTRDQSVEVDRGPADGAEQSDAAKSPDLVSKSTGSNAGTGANPEKTAGTAGSKTETLGPKARQNFTIEGPMSAVKRAEIEQHWKELCESTLSEQEFRLLMQENMEMFGDVSDPDQDASVMLRGFRAITGSRLGLDNPKAKASEVEGGLPLGDSALRNLPMAIREGNVRFRLSEDGQDGKEGAVKAKPHDSKTLRYAWRVGLKVMTVEINRRAAAAELLDVFDPERRQG